MVVVEVVEVGLEDVLIVGQAFVGFECIIGVHVHVVGLVGEDVGNVWVSLFVDHGVTIGLCNK